MENRWIQNLLSKINNTGIPKGYRGYPIENIENALKENISDAHNKGECHERENN